LFVIDTIEDEIVLFRALAIGDKVSRAAPAGISKWWRDPRSQLSDVNPVAAVERGIVDGPC